MLRLCCLLVLVPFLAVPANAEGETSVAVIVHPDVPADSLSRSQLLDFFTGDIQRWSDGTSVVVLDLKAKGVVREGFYDLLGRRPSRMKSIWLRRMLSGEGDPPEALATETEILRRVATTPGALGYVNSDSVTAAVRVVLRVRHAAPVSQGNSGP